MNLYDFSAAAHDGSIQSFDSLKGKVVLITNTATECGFTPQYKDLQALYEKKHAEGLEILDFPCNQFGAQAPGTADEIHLFCTGRFGVTFPQYAKVDVNGENAHPLFQWLTANTTFQGFDKLNPLGLILSQIVKKDDPNYKESGSIKWNFTKFLVDKKGSIRARFEPTASMKKVSDMVDALLKEED